jgi:hypothetical protein
MIRRRDNPSAFDLALIVSTINYLSLRVSIDTSERSCWSSIVDLSLPIERYPEH